MKENNLLGRYIAYFLSLLTAAAIVGPVACPRYFESCIRDNTQKVKNAIRENPDSGLQLKVGGEAGK